MFIYNENIALISTINFYLCLTVLHLKRYNQNNMKFSIDKQEKYAVLTLQEDNLNSLIAPQLKSDFTLFHAEGIPNFIFDISHVKFVDSSGLSAILTAKRLWDEDGSFILTGVNSPSVKKLIEISKLDTAFTIIPTVEESIDYVFMEQIERELSEED